MSTYLLWFWSDGLTRLFFHFNNKYQRFDYFTTVWAAWIFFDFLEGQWPLCWGQGLSQGFPSFSLCFFFCSFQEKSLFVSFLFGIPSCGILCCHNRQFPPEYASLFVVFSFAALTYLYMMLTHCRWSHDHTTTKHSREEGRAKCACMSHRTFWHALYPKITGIYQTSGPC